MVEKKPKPVRREPGQRRLQLPERQPRQPDENPIKETLARARSQEANLHNPTPTTATTPTTTTTPTTPTTPIAPARDFTRVANSIVRKAVPDGYFAGKGKQLYDYLYSVTRGAIIPTRSVRMPMSHLMNRSGIGSDRTLRKNLARLVDVGLVSVNEIGGTQGGNEFTVFLPEELTTPTTPTTPTTHPLQKVGVVPVVESGRGGGGLNVANTATSVEPKTSFKTNTNDDDKGEAVLADLVSILCEASQKLTGGSLRAGEREQWAEVGRIIANELNEAAARASAVSSVPAFLAAHLRRKFAHKPSQPKGEGKPQPSTPKIDVPPAASGKRLTADEITEQSRLIADLLEGGYTIEQAEAQFSGSFHPDDWQGIKEMIIRS
jgi:hypothetical protein